MKLSDNNFMITKNDDVTANYVVSHIIYALLMSGTKMKLSLLQ